MCIWYNIIFAFKLNTMFKISASVEKLLLCCILSFGKNFDCEYSGHYK